MDAMHNALEPVSKEVRRTFCKAVLYKLIYWFDFPLREFLVKLLLAAVSE
jgi:hypothetical protein